MIVNLYINRIFLDGKPIKFRIDDYTFTKDSIQSYLKWFEEETDEEHPEKELLRQYRNFQATCQPAFFIAKFKQSGEQSGEQTKRFDFFSKALECVLICQEQQKNYEEYESQFENVKVLIEEFLGKKMI